MELESYSDFIGVAAVVAAVDGAGIVVLATNKCGPTYILVLVYICM